MIDSLLKVLANIDHDGDVVKGAAVRVESSAAIRGVSPSDLRRINERVVLEAMSPGESYRVTELIETTALTRVTVTDVLRQLQDKGWVTARASTGGRGRPAQVFGRVVAPGVVAGLDLGAHELAASLADLTGTVLDRERTSVDRDLPRTERLDRAASLVHTLLSRTGHVPGDLWSVLAATTGTVTEDGLVSHSVAIADWAGTDLIRELADRLGVPVEARNDIQLFGRAEHLWGAAAGYQHALLVWLGRRPAVSLILHGRPHTGAHGTAGDLSRVGLSPSDTAWSGHGRWLPAPEVEAAPNAAPEDPLPGLLAAARAGDQEALTALQHWLEAISPFISLFAAVIDPEVIVIGGPLVPLAEKLLPVLERDLAVHLQQRPPIRLASGGEDAVVDAASRYAADRVHTRLIDNGGTGVAPLDRTALRELA